jgi:hypothetical protein
MELEIEGDIDLPVKTSTSNWGAALAKALKKAFSTDEEESNIEIYNVNYGQNVQAFFVKIPIIISNSLNPNDYLKEFADYTKFSSPQALEIDESIEIPSFDNLKLSCPISQPITIISGTETAVISDKFIIDVNNSEISLPYSVVNSDSLRARIKEGDINIELDFNEKDDFEITYNINIKQDYYTKDSLGPYSGLDYSSGQLAGQYINKNPVKINGTVTLEPKVKDGTVTVTTTGGKLEGQLIIKMNIKKIQEIDLDIREISKGLELDSVSLAEAAEYLNYIKFDKCSSDTNGELNAGIGIKVNFTEIIDGLKMSIECDALRFKNTFKSLSKGDNVFGNEEDFKLVLAGYENPSKQLEFEIKFNEVLHLTDPEAGKTLSIKGNAELFQHWTEAEVNIADVLNASLENGDFEGKYPDVDNGEKPIDLSLLDDYLKGFSFTGIEAAAYLSGPEKTIEALTSLKPKLKIDAEYSETETPINIMDMDPITLDQECIVIKDNPNYLDSEGSYKRNRLPTKGNTFNFVDVINAMPDELVFNYKVDMPDTIKIKPDMFVDDNNGNVSSDIVANIMLLIHLELETGDNGGSITFPDMFQDQNDLLGRQSLDNNFLFTSFNVDYISFSVDFTNAFFTGGKLFIEKDNGQQKLFPEGISLGGGRITINITNNSLDFIKKNYIDPDFRLEFEPGSKITIPRNIGVTSVKIAAKSKNSIKLDF